MMGAVTQPDAVRKKRDGGGEAGEEALGSLLPEVRMEIWPSTPPQFLTFSPTPPGVVVGNELGDICTPAHLPPGLQAGRFAACQSANPLHYSDVVVQTNVWNRAHKALQSESTFLKTSRRIT